MGAAKTKRRPRAPIRPPPKHLLPAKVKAKETQGAKAEEAEEATEVVQARNVAEALAAGRRILAERNKEAMKAADAVAKKAEEAMAADHARRHFEAEAAKKLGEAIELEEAWQRAEQARDLTEAAVQCLTKEKNEHTKKKHAWDREKTREKKLAASRKW